MKPPDAADTCTCTLETRLRLDLLSRIVASIVMLGIMCAGCTCTSFTRQPASPPERITLLPIAGYNQDVDHWINPSRPDYDSPFLSQNLQRAQAKRLLARYFGTGRDDPSPWNPSYIEAEVYHADGADLAKLQHNRIDRFDNTQNPTDRIAYGQNFRPHTKAWIDDIARNVEPDQFTRTHTYAPANRAITTANALVRLLPTMDPAFYDYRIPGEGYPFDNLQITAAHPGTPVYVLGTSQNGAWRYVRTPNVQGWVRSQDLGMVDEAFVARWRDAARAQPGAVVDASTSVRDTTNTFLFAPPVGTLLPIAADSGTSYDVLVPVRTADGLAAIRTARIARTQIVPVPWPATPRHLATLMKTLIGRPYGWGNAGFYNDCSSELQGIFAIFGLWLPRHSSAQLAAGQMIDLSAASPAERLDYLMSHGRPMRTIVYVGAHVMLYLGNAVYGGKTVPLTYQDIWGLRPKDNSRRAVIGGSVILPLLPTIPEDPALISLAAKPVFRISALGEVGLAAQEECPPERGMSSAALPHIRSSLQK
ncbi:SH3 domain-containing C40 family peptidase [Burkholderia ambifaria]|uniref:Putative cell wall-associated hydrolase protein n=1 Tax=Burkholderia ambifaria MEX-5 TaxID=396597 RepID=B1TG84_9BURK|nr:SH3 domain-containing C40 family peptidase [Burkholderia ambifaria]EDT37422.1 putative cell wall-associated hydrolase protein [Burkholderia ambifaria MEX-5]